MISIFEEIDSSDGGKDLATSIWNLSINIGDSLGPSLGGVISSTTNFEKCCTSISFINFIFALVFYFYFNKKNLKEKKNEVRERNESLITYKTNKTEKIVHNHDLLGDFNDGNIKRSHKKNHSTYSLVSSLSVNTHKTRQLVRRISDSSHENSGIQ